MKKKKDKRKRKRKVNEEEGPFTFLLNLKQAARAAKIPSVHGW